ncbi:hypothetical protein Zmor_027704 [Zophobas morio]|uniref:Uncharacterized protein n=1 Tax=Zophobas morio TaxID=2755281 RepID=A0AA38HTY2_9CUCU|nr:hypothetical protein Zmor_027704 [Zophobas morio]
MGSEHYCLRWNNHQSNLLGVFSQLLRDESLVDVTLACSEGHSIRAHKVVLSACSSYFQTLFVDHPSRHPIVILKDVRFAELRTLIEFMYKGEVNVEYCQLSALLKTAESLKVKGLAEMTREYKHTEPEQTEPTELIRRPPGSRSPSVDENDRLQPPPSPPVQNLRVCRSPMEQDDDKRPPSPENTHGSSPLTSDCGPSDMTIHSNSNNMAAPCPGINAPIICSTRLPSPISEPLPGPSNMPPVQQVPLSLKKEVDWSGGIEDKNTGESSSDFSRHPHDSELDREGSPRLYPCMYCGTSFPHQSKLTRHILSHSLETLKYREQLPPPWGAAPPPDPTDQPPTADAELEAAGGVVLCKFCGKSFPDVSSLISHLPVHTGDRPFKCEFCGKAFKLRHHMKDHCRVHTGERPFRCALCGKTFSRSTILKAHEKTHYPKYVRKFLSPSPLDTEEESPH